MHAPTSLVHKRDLLPVLLSPIIDSDQNDDNLDAQFVRIRSGNIATLYIDSQKPYYEYDPSNIKISSANVAAGRAENLIDKANRIAISYFEMFWQPVNVTPYNRSYTWILYKNSDATTTSYSHVIPTNNYTLDELLTLIVNTMNNDIAALSIGTVSYLLLAGKRSVITLDAVGYKFYFSETCDLVVKGQPLLGIPILDTPTVQMIVGPSRMLYTRYVDVVSSDLCKYIKNPPKSINRISNNIVHRQYMTSTNDDFTYYSDIKHLSWINWNPKGPLPIIDFRLYDENGDPFYYVPPTTRTTASMSWLMNILLEY